MSGSLGDMVARALQKRLPPQDFTGRLRTMRPAVDNADPSMVAPPVTDPGYAMPNVDQGNVNQSPGQTVLGYLPAATQMQQQQGMQDYVRRYLLQQQAAGVNP